MTGAPATLSCLACASNHNSHRRIHLTRSTPSEMAAQGKRPSCRRLSHSRRCEQQCHVSGVVSWARTGGGWYAISQSRQESMRGLKKDEETEDEQRKR